MHHALLAASLPPLAPQQEKIFGQHGVPVAPALAHPEPNHYQPKGLSL